MQQKLVGITGLARSGKDSFARTFCDAGYYRIAFADPLKRMAAYLAREPARAFFSDVGKEEVSPGLGVTRRKALQGLGVAVRDSIGPDVWVNFALAEWRDCKKAPAVISDVRFDNEAQAIRNEGGTIIRIIRPGAGLVGAAAQHSSEAGIDDDLVDIEILNDGSLSELATEARKIIYILGKPSFAKSVMGEPLKAWSA